MDVPFAWLDYQCYNTWMLTLSIKMRISVLSVMDFNTYTKSQISKMKSDHGYMLLSAIAPSLHEMEHEGRWTRGQFSQPHLQNLTLECKDHGSGMSTWNLSRPRILPMKYMSWLIDTWPYPGGKAMSVNLNTEFKCAYMSTSEGGTVRHLWRPEHDWWGAIFNRIWKKQGLSDPRYG